MSKFPYAGQVPNGRPPVGNEPKSARIDLRLTPDNRAAVDMLAHSLRRTLASLLDEALEDILKKYADKV